MKMLRKIVKEAISNVVKFDVARARKNLKRFEALIFPFISSWDESVREPGHLAEFLSRDDLALYASLLREYRYAGTRLSQFLRGVRQEMIDASRGK